MKIRAVPSMGYLPPKKLARFLVELDCWGILTKMQSGEYDVRYVVKEYLTVATDLS